MTVPTNIGGLGVSRPTDSTIMVRPKLRNRSDLRPRRRHGQIFCVHQRSVPCSFVILTPKLFQFRRILGLFLRVQSREGYMGRTEIVPEELHHLARGKREFHADLLPGGLDFASTDR